MKKPLMLFTICLTLLSAVYVSCKKQTPTDEDTVPITDTTTLLYTQLGGTGRVIDPIHPGQLIENGRLKIRSIVDSSILVIAADVQLAPYFAVLFAELGNKNTTGLEALSKNLTDMFCTDAGSKNELYTYKGKSMKDAHDPSKNNRMGLKANAADFDKFVGDFGVGLELNGITVQNNKKIIDAFISILYSKKSDIVQR